MVVSWSTINDTKGSAVKYGENLASLVYQALGNSTLFVDGGTENRSQYIHTVTLTGLTPGKTYGKLDIVEKDIIILHSNHENNRWDIVENIFGIHCI